MMRNTLCRLGMPECLVCQENVVTGRHRGLSPAPGFRSRSGWLSRELHPYGHWTLTHQSHYVDGQRPGWSCLQLA